jgi:argonaute-like protein implicated in RNA metabolism and viral defense
MNFFCVYVNTRKKLDKFFKVNRVRGKYILDVKKMMEEENIDPDGDKIYLKILIFNKVQRAIEKNRDIYYIPNFDEDFSIEKLLNLRKILGENNFNILLFYEEFEKKPHIREEALENLSKFSNSQIIRDY